VPNKSLVALTRHRAGAVLASFVFTTVFVIGTACAPPPAPEQQAPLFRSRFDSLVAATARDSSPEWRAAHFPTVDLHGPFPRPELPAGADTNDAVAYFKLGATIAWRAQGLADRAFYWALRLDPTMADAYYARWDVRRHGSYYRLFPDDSVRPVFTPSPNDAAALDSLRVSALMYDPFLDVALNISPQIRIIAELQADRDPATSGLRAYAMGNYAKAVKKWGEAIREKPENAGLHVPRAFAWLRLKGERDSAIADLTALIDRLEHIEDSTIAPYRSKDFLYYAVGFLRTGQRRYAEARTAYESALSENLGFYMAHVRLSAIDYSLHDTTAALNELETASLMRSDDPVLLALRGQILLGQGRLREAESQLRAAVHADTDFALSYAFLGQVAEQRRDTTNALRGYHEYLARASHAAPERGWVEDHVAHLTNQSPRK
jgi:tetratricopeptide (TPR) repeat protein